MVSSQISKLGFTVQYEANDTTPETFEVCLGSLFLCLVYNL